ncbi:MAG TPA: LuxR C-terminal-related transcriptional regulator [Solirubrobacteraceae bacterium]|nr:LuxR C-terminal-related transcriptional regulator [Solirubrobacteraceae bacterium]
MTTIGVTNGRLEDRDFRLLFARSLDPMLVTDDERRIVDANPAACLFLRLTLEAVRELTIDDLSTPGVARAMDVIWADFLAAARSRAPRRTFPWDLKMPDGTTLAVDVCSFPEAAPGRHLAVIRFPAAREQHASVDRGSLGEGERVLTSREREVLTLVALGRTGVQIAGRLFLSPATVETHVTNALIKLGAKNRAHGIATALRLRELDLDTLAIVAAHES